jgi:hypothetical protein
MHFLPINRWQGGLLGSWLAQSLTPSVNPHLYIGQHLLEALVEKRQLAEQDWLNLYQKYPDELKTSRSGDMILALMPLFLLHHDDRQELERQLSLVQTLWQLPREAIDDGVVWGDLTSAILGEQLQPQRWLEQVIQVARSRQTPLPDLLESVRRLLRDGTPLRLGVRQLSRQERPDQLAIALAIYCFGTTPDDLRLSLLRACHLQEQSASVVALTGFLSGSYNSLSGFPVSWRIASKDFPTTSLLRQQILQLFAVWSGVYQPNADHPLPSSTLAASGVIQRRTSFKIVSQDQMEK